MKKFNMKKTTTAAVAATVGAVLLLGGAGTLAYWNDTVNSDAQTISSGSLDLGAIDGTKQQWTVTNGTRTSVPLTGAVVPGDVLSTTMDVPVTLSGQNIEAVLTVGTPKLVASPASADAAALISKLKATVTQVGEDEDTNSTRIVGTKNATTPVPVTITVTFDALTDTQVAQLQTIDFTVDYTLEQQAATPTATK
jgi:alternate signal-mediated exported protein